MLSLLFFSSLQTVISAEITPAEARIREMGRITPEGQFSFWNDGTIGDRFVAQGAGRAELKFTARGVAVNGEWPLVAIELVAADAGAREVGRLSINSSPMREFTLEFDLPKTPFELRIRQLNRQAGTDPKVLRHLNLSKFSVSNAQRFDGALLETALFGQKEIKPAGESRKIKTQHLDAELWPASGAWRVSDAQLGTLLEQVRPVLHAGGQSIDLAAYRSECVIAEENSPIMGPATKASLRYRKAGGLDIDYTLWFSRAGHEVLAQIDFTNNTGNKIKVVRTAPVICGAASVGGAVSDWAVLGDAKENSQPYQLVDGASVTSLEAWWHTAIKNRANGHSLLAGSLSNRKGLGRFVVCGGGKQALRLAAYSDYEGIEMPAGAHIEGEPFLLCFASSGNVALERFGELIAKANRIELLRDHPLDTHTPKGLALFTSLNTWGASVIKGFKYEFDHAKGTHALMDPAWAKLNAPKISELGLDKFGYGGNRANVGISGAPGPLARRYGQPDFWAKDVGQLAKDHPEYYLGGYIDFSRPAVQEIERQRVAKAFAQAKGTVNYSWDFTDKWRHLTGEHDPFLTSADTYRLAMGIWREAGRKHPAGAYGFVWMNVVGLNYDLVDVIHIGHDSDTGYGGEGLTFTHGLTRQISGRYFYNGRVWWNSPDSFHVYGGGVYSAPQAKVHASFNAIAGNLVHLGEPLGHQQTPGDRLEIVRRVSPTMADVARAVDVFEHNPARLWSIPVQRAFGQWTVAGLFNVDFDGRGTPITQEIRLADLGLDPQKDYLVYEFWSRKFLGTWRGSSTRTLAAPDCEIYSLVEKTDRPALISTSRHVRQMAYELLDCRWEAAKQTLSGRSLTVAADPYQLRIYVPENFKLKSALAGGQAAKTAGNSSLLEVDFPGQTGGEVNWEIRFEKAK